MEQYAKYLRKSRFDRDYAELSVEETLKRHETILDKMAGDRGYQGAPPGYAWLEEHRSADYRRGAGNPDGGNRRH